MLRIIILFIAISAGGLSAWLLLAAKPAPHEVAATETQMAEVLVASVDLAQGRVLSEQDLRWQSWPQDSVGAGYISRSSKPDGLTSLKGSMVRHQIVAGEPVREEKLARVSSGMLASMLPPGKRAVAIRVSADSTAGGFILPNDRVDVIQTNTRAGQQGQAETLSSTILSNIRVLAIDQKADETKDQAVVVGKTATLELDAEQAEIIAAGQVTGILSLSLRSFADHDAESLVKRSVRVFRAGTIETVRIQ